MQSAELFRRSIVLPTTSEAEERLRRNDVDEDIVVRRLEIPSESLFESLWDLKLFLYINRLAGSMIDDYEEEMLEPSQMESLLTAVQRVRQTGHAVSPDVQSFLNDLSTLAADAAKLHRPLLFVL